MLRPRSPLWVWRKHTRQTCQEGGGEVARVVLSGAALDLPGFAEALQEQLGNEVERESVHLDGQDLGGISAHRLAIAAGLAVEEAPQ